MSTFFLFSVILNSAIGDRRMSIRTRFFSSVFFGDFKICLIHCKRVALLMPGPPNTWRRCDSNSWNPTSNLVDDLLRQPERTMFKFWGVDEVDASSGQRAARQRNHAHTHTSQKKLGVHLSNRLQILKINLLKEAENVQAILAERALSKSGLHAHASLHTERTI